MAVGVERELGRDPVVAAVVIGDEAPRALVGPFHRPAERARGMQRADIFGIDGRLHAEGTADIPGDDVHRFGLDPQHLGDRAAHAEHALRGDVEREASVLMDRHCRARLHRIDHDPVVDELEPGDVRGLRERLRDLLAVAVVIIERDIVRCLLIEHRRARPRGRFRIGDGRQRIDVDLDRLGRVLGLQQRLRHHEGDRIADKAHLVGRQRMARRLLHRRAVAIVERYDAFERAVAGRIEIGAGIDPEHARHGAGRRAVDPANDAVRVAAAHHHRIDLAGQADIVGVAAFAADQLGILGAQHRLADPEFGDGPAIGIALQVHERRSSAGPRSFRPGPPWRAGGYSAGG